MVSHVLCALYQRRLVVVLAREIALVWVVTTRVWGRHHHRFVVLSLTDFHFEMGEDEHVFPGCPPPDLLAVSQSVRGGGMYGTVSTGCFIMLHTS